MRPEVPRAKLLERIASLPPCLIGMEACSCAHRWARAFAAFGHSVRLMAPKFVHRARQGYVEQRTVLINRIRGLVSELGIVQPSKQSQCAAKPTSTSKTCRVVQHPGGRCTERADPSGCSEPAVRPVH